MYENVSSQSRGDFNLKHHFESVMYCKGTNKNSISNSEEDNLK